MLKTREKVEDIQIYKINLPFNRLIKNNKPVINMNPPKKQSQHRMKPFSRQFAKYFFIILLIHFSITGKTQKNIDSLISISICDCLNEYKGLTAENFTDCFEYALLKDSALYQSEIITAANESDYDAGLRFGRELGERISVSLIFSCPVFFQLMDTTRYEAIKQLNKDSLNMEVQSLLKNGSTEETEILQWTRGLLHFKLSEYDNAIKYFDLLLANNPSNYTVLLFKGLGYEGKEQHNEAIECYNKLVTLSGKPEFKVYAAIAQQKKKNSLELRKGK